MILGTRADAAQPNSNMSGKLTRCWIMTGSPFAPCSMSAMSSSSSAASSSSLHTPLMLSKLQQMVSSKPPEVGACTPDPVKLWAAVGDLWLCWCFVRHNTLGAASPGLCLQRWAQALPLAAADTAGVCIADLAASCYGPVLMSVLPIFIRPTFM